METDNSRILEEKFQEGYNKRWNEITHANLFVIETDLFELTDKVRSHFEEMYSNIHGNDFNAKQLRSIALDYIQTNGTCIATNIHSYNY